jgi:carbon monoxide dehydrogenase subunit G
MTFMLHFEGDQHLPFLPPAVWVRLCDGRFLVHCIPDIDEVTRAEPLHAEFSIRPGFAFVRGNLRTSLQITEAEPGQTVRYEIDSKGIGSHCAVEATLDLAESHDGTRVHWTCDIKELGGLLKAVPKGLVQAAAQKVIADIWTAIEQRLAPSPTM